MISILIPTYKPNPQHLQEALQCLMEQSEQDWECVITNDPSEVDVKSIVEPFLADKRFTYHENTQRKGIGGNWNTALEHATGTYVQYLFQDDAWHPDYLATMKKALDNNEQAGFATADHLYAYEGDIHNRDGYERVRTSRNLLLGSGLQNGVKTLRWWIDHKLHPNIIGEPSFVMFRKSMMNAVGPFDENMPQFLDVEYMLRCLQRGDFVSVKQELGAFRVHKDGASAQNEVSGAGIYDRLMCFERLIATLEDKELRTSAIKARNNALTDMARKFLDRKKGGKQTSISAGKGKMIEFAMRHPWLCVQALLKAMMTKK